MDALPGYLVVFVGAGLGGMFRHGINRIALAVGSSYPWNTLLVNVSGCLLMGLFAGWLAFRGDASQTLRLFLMTGVLGGFTTFSAFSLDVSLLWERGDLLGAVSYVASSVALSVAGVFVGIAIMRPPAP